jgi:dihydroneopterin aldolase
MAHTEKLTSTLAIRNLELDIFIGWPDEERVREQTIVIDINIDFLKPPKACTSDALEDTFCYAKLINKIKEELYPAKFHLVESLTATLYQIVKRHLKNSANVVIHVTKKPSIHNLKGGICFSFGDGN